MCLCDFRYGLGYRHLADSYRAENTFAPDDFVVMVGRLSCADQGPSHSGAEDSVGSVSGYGRSVGSAPGDYHFVGDSDCDGRYDSEYSESVDDLVHYDGAPGGFLLSFGHLSRHSADHHLDPECS